MAVVMIVTITKPMVMIIYKDFATPPADDDDGNDDVLFLFMIMMKPHPQLHQAVLQGDDAGTKHPLHPHLQTSYITCSEGGHTQDIPRNHFTEVESPVTTVHMKEGERPKCEPPIFERY